MRTSQFFPRSVFTTEKMTGRQIVICELLFSLLSPQSCATLALLHSLYGAGQGGGGVDYNHPITESHLGITLQPPPSAWQMFSFEEYLICIIQLHLTWSYHISSNTEYSIQYTKKYRYTET